MLQGACLFWRCDYSHRLQCLGPKFCALIELASEAVRVTDDEDHDEGEGLFCRVQIGVEEADWLKKDDQQAVMLEEPVSLLPLESLL